MGHINSHHDLTVWNKAMDLVAEIYRLSDQLPKSEQFGLVSQMNRAAVSVPADIAEGHARSAAKEYRRFLSISKGALMELETYLQLMSRLRYLPSTEIEQALGLVDEISRMIAAVRRKLNP